MIRSKDLGLLVALTVLAFLAVSSPKKILIAEGFAITREELEEGGLLYGRFCASCHAEGADGAPRTGHREAWQKRIDGGMPLLVRHAVKGYRGKTGYMPPKGGYRQLSVDEVALATAWIVQQSSPD
jgi:cytochrome c5